MYEYDVEVLRVIDGDTIDVRVSLGFYCFKQERLRLAGLDTPELTSSDALTRASAREAKAYVEQRLAGKIVRICSEKPHADDKYGRFLCVVNFRAPEEAGWSCLNSELLGRGLARAYDGGARPA